MIFSNIDGLIYEIITSQLCSNGDRGLPHSGLRFDKLLSSFSVLVLNYIDATYFCDFYAEQLMLFQLTD